MIGYTYGVYDILRAKELQELDMLIQKNQEKEAKAFGIGIYEKELCENLGLGIPLKDIEDRMKIAKQLRGVDFVFKISTLDEKIVHRSAREAYLAYVKETGEMSKKIAKEKQYKLGYAPGTYDLFHAGHLENLRIASENCEKLIVGVKADELVKEQKNRDPIISDEERMEILRHFKFVYGTYKFYTRDLYVASDSIKKQYEEPVDAIFVGDDLKKDYSKLEGLNIVYTPRDEEKMKTYSTSNYRKLHLINLENKKYKGKVPKGEKTEKSREDLEQKER